MQLLAEKGLVKNEDNKVSVNLIPSLDLINEFLCPSYESGGQSKEKFSRAEEYLKEHREKRKKSALEWSVQCRFVFLFRFNSI